MNGLRRDRLRARVRSCTATRPCDHCVSRSYTQYNIICCIVMICCIFV